MSESSAPENVPAAETPDISALNKRLEGAQSELELLRRRLKRSSIISTTIGVLLLLLLTGYFTYGYMMIRSFINEPQEMVSLIGQTVEDYLPQARQDLETTIKESAPQWAEMASEELIASAPKIREQLEELAFEQTEVLVGKLSGFTAKQFQDFLENERPMFEASMKELSSGQKPPDQTMAELTEALEKELHVNIEKEAETILHGVYAMNEKLKKLSEGREDLKEGEVHLRRAMMILRRVQLEQSDPSFVGKKWIPPSKGDAATVEETPDKPDEKPKAEAKEEETEPKAEAPTAKAKEEAEPKGETPAPEAKEETKPKAEAPAPEAKEEAKPKAEAPAPEAEKKPDPVAEPIEPEKAKADEPKPE